MLYELAKNTRTLDFIKEARLKHIQPNPTPTIDLEPPKIASKPYWLDAISLSALLQHTHKAFQLANH